MTRGYFPRKFEINNNTFGNKIDIYRKSFFQMNHNE